MPKRVNKAVELLSQDQPIYYTGSHTGANLTYEAGKAMSKTWADYINVGFEHGLFDLIGLDNFMRGLADDGPTNSGHQTPAVVIEIPVNGTSAAAIQANDWQFRQLLARGVHGLLLCHAENPEAVKTFVEYCRYPFQKIGVGSQKVLILVLDQYPKLLGENLLLAILRILFQNFFLKKDLWHH